MGLATTVLVGLLFPLQQAPAPFTLELPEDYPAFTQAASPEAEVWVSLRGDEAAQFEIRHFLLAAPGARADLVAANLRTERWEPLMRGFGSKIKPWEGNWNGGPAAGHQIDYVYERKSQSIVQRISVDDEHLLIATWEGPRSDFPAAAQALEGFRAGAAWRAAAPPTRDEERGLGPTATPPPPLGHFQVAIDATDASWAEVGIEIQLEPPPGRTLPEKPDWILPEGAILDEQSAKQVRYRVSLVDEEGRPVGRAGFSPGPGCLAALSPGWLALPRALAGPDGRFAAPELSLVIRCSPHLGALSDVAVEKTWLDGTARATEFVTRPGGGTWPIFLIGFYDFREVEGRRLGLRRSAESPSPERTLRAMNDLTEAAVSIWPAADPSWSVLTFPGAGDAVFRSLLVLDEGLRWLRDPLESTWIDGDRRTGLARKLGFLWFGRQLAGRGHGAVFLEASLSEYAAWRILEAAGAQEAAQSMRNFWSEQEQELGELPRPLSLLPRADLAGARRLMTRGALVWRALEARAGRASLDRILNARLAAGGSWTTEDLRSELERATQRDWADWFAAHVYGRSLP